MISPWTAPGTKVVCINIGEIKKGHNGGIYLKLNEIYTIEEITMSDYWSCLVAILKEIKHPSPLTKGFALERFRRLLTPEDFTCDLTEEELENV